MRLSQQPLSTGMVKFGAHEKCVPTEPHNRMVATMIKWSLGNKTHRAEMLTNNDFAIQKDVAVYFKTNFMFLCFVKPSVSAF